MSEFEDFSVPFTTIGNRRCLTDQQMAEMPFLWALVRAFPKSFERDHAVQVLWFVEPEIEAE